MNDQHRPGAGAPAAETLPSLADLKRTLRITAPIVHSPSHGTSQFASRSARPGMRQPTYSYQELASMDWLSGEEN